VSRIKIMTIKLVINNNAKIEWSKEKCKWYKLKTIWDFQAKDILEKIQAEK